uniref:Uncharacterized protein n=1 Tax=Anguilla anguilla TaxID=7936 RepID=A0A0E9QF24_ANGAN
MRTFRFDRKLCVRTFPRTIWDSPFFSYLYLFMAISSCYSHEWDCA